MVWGWGVVKVRSISKFDQKMRLRVGVTILPLGRRFCVIFGVFGIWGYPHEGQLFPWCPPLGAWAIGRRSRPALDGPLSPPRRPAQYRRAHTHTHVHRTYTRARTHARTRPRRRILVCTRRACAMPDAGTRRARERSGARWHGQ